MNPDQSADDNMEPSLEGKRGAALLSALGILFLVALWTLRRLATGDTPTVVKQAAWLTPLLAIASLIIGIALVRTSVQMLVQRTSDYLGASRVRAGQSLISTILYILVAIAVAGQTQVDLSGIALSGAVTGVVVGIAAQASLANIVAGLVILFARPFRPGQFVTVRASAFAGSEYSGEVGEVTLFYTTIYTGPQEIRVPNSAMVTSVVTLRSQVLEVYLPVLIPPANWHTFSSVALAHHLTQVLPEGRRLYVVVERMDATGVQIGVHASVANEQERSLLERALVQNMRSVFAVSMTEPHPDSL